VTAGFTLSEGRPVRRMDADIHVTARAVHPAARTAYVARE
jgi:hypothetical protein